MTKQETIETYTKFYKWDKPIPSQILAEIDEAYEQLGECCWFTDYMNHKIYLLAMSEVVPFTDCSGFVNWLDFELVEKQAEDAELKETYKPFKIRTNGVMRDSKEEDDEGGDRAFLLAEQASECNDGIISEKEIGEFLHSLYYGDEERENRPLIMNRETCPRYVEQEREKYAWYYDAWDNFTAGRYDY